MGCDIHMAVEVRRDGKWRWEQGTTPCIWCEPDPPADQQYRKREKANWCCRGTGMMDAYDGRNYDLFGILADVRNGVGFAGCDTGDTWPPIAKDRGLPKDMSAELQEAVEKHEADVEGEDGFWFGDHSFTHLTLAELLAYPWDDVVRAQRGVVSMRQFAHWDGRSAPASYCGDVFGPGVVIMSRTAADEFLSRNESVRAALLSKPPAERTSGDDGAVPEANGMNVRIQWNETAREAAGPQFMEFVQNLQALATKNGVEPKDVRLVMGFDS